MKIVTVPMKKGSLAADYLKKIFIYQNNYLILIMAFLLAHGNVFGDLLPSGAIFFAAAYKVAGTGFLTAAAVLLGAATRASPEVLFINGLSMLLYSVLSRLWKSRDVACSQTNLKAAAILSASVMLPRLVCAGFDGFLLYDVLKTLFGSFFAFVLYFIFSNTVPVISRPAKAGMREITEEGLISIAVTGGLIIAGIGTVNVFGFSLKNILCVAMLLIFSYKSGPAAGAAAGAAAGLISGLPVNFTPAGAGTFALCGMLAGMLGKLGRIGPTLGFVLGNMAVSIYLNSTAETGLYLKDIMAGALLFFVLPAGLMDKIKMMTAAGDTSQHYEDGCLWKARDVVNGKLNSLSRTFRELSKTFGSFAATETDTNQRDINVLLDRVANRVCSDCSFTKHCWERNFYDTCQVMFGIIDTLNIKGKVEDSDIPRHFQERCAKAADLIAAVNNMYELFKAEILWRGKCNESRAITGLHFEIFSRLISELIPEIDSGICFLRQPEEKISIMLRKAAIDSAKVAVWKNTRDRYEVDITHRADYGRCEGTDIEKAVSEVIGRRMVSENGDFCKIKNGICHYKLMEAENLKITTGVARLPRYGSNASGDSFTFSYSGRGKFALALSDGMGTGCGAAVNSGTAIGLLENLLETGYDKNLAIYLINSMFVLKQEEDSSCTIDLSVIDLYDGKAEFVKIGAAPAFLKRRDKVEIIRSASLPAGVFLDMNVEQEQKAVGPGDMIIMVSDGITDSLTTAEAGEEVLMRYLRELGSLNPQLIAECILNEANASCENKPCDDMTVLVAKVWKRGGA